MTGLATSGSTRSVDRALALLAEISAQDSLTLSECARRTQLPASTALRLLRTLESSGFIARDVDGGYRAGVRMMQFGALALARQSLVALAAPNLGRIVAQTGESSYLVIHGPADTAVYVAMVEGTHAVRHTSWVGRAISVVGLAVGRALAGAVPASGYVAQRDNVEPDITAIAAPVRAPGGVVAALNLLGPTYRIDEDTMHRYGAIVSAEAATLAANFTLQTKPDPNPLQEATSP